MKIPEDPVIEGPHTFVRFTSRAQLGFTVILKNKFFVLPAWGGEREPFEICQGTLFIYLFFLRKPAFRGN